MRLTGAAAATRYARPPSTLKSLQELSYSQFFSLSSPAKHLRTFLFNLKKKRARERIEPNPVLAFRCSDVGSYSTKLLRFEWIEKLVPADEILSEIRTFCGTEVLSLSLSFSLSLSLSLSHTHPDTHTCEHTNTHFLSWLHRNAHLRQHTHQRVP